MKNLKPIAVLLWFGLIAANFIYFSEQISKASDPTFRFEVELFHALVGWVLSFPLGAAVSFAAMGFLEGVLDIHPSPLYAGLYVALISGLTGYWQWFVLLPRAWKKFCKWRSAN